MAKFVYQLQSLLNIKQKLEEQEKTAYGLARSRLNEEEAKLTALLQKREYYVERKRQEMSSRVRVQELAALEQAIHSLTIQITEQQLSVKRAEKAVAAAQLRLENARKERKMQEKLREHAMEQFLREMEAEEQKEINELVTFRFGARIKQNQ